MEQYKNHIREWQEMSIKLNEAMQKKDFDLCDKLISECNDVYNDYKDSCVTKEENLTRSFGELNHMLESKLPSLFKDDKKTLKECTNLIKNDKNLRNAFRFINSLRNYNHDCDPYCYVNESVSLSLVGIDKDNFKESVSKLAEMLNEHGINKCDIDEETVKFYKACDAIISGKKSISNLNEYTKNISSVVEYLNGKKKDDGKNTASISDISESLESKIANLTEDEQSLVKDIIDFKAPMVEKKQKDIFEKFKNECIDLVNNLIVDSDGSDKENLENIKDQIEKKEYQKESIVSDIAKLLEIRDVLLDK